MFLQNKFRCPPIESSKNLQNLKDERAFPVQCRAVVALRSRHPCVWVIPFLAYRGYSKLRTHITLGPYGSFMSRGIGPS